MGFAEVELSRADEVADVFNQNGAAVLRFQVMKRLVHHGGVEVAALARVDLNGLRAGRADAVSVVRRFLIAFDHGDRELLGISAADRFGEQLSLSGSGARNEVQSEDVMLCKEGAVPGCNSVVAGKDVFFNGDRGLVGVVVLMSMGMFMIVRVGMIVIMSTSSFMIMVVIVMMIVLVFSSVNRHVAVFIRMGMHMGMITTAAAGCTHSV